MHKFEQQFGKWVVKNRWFLIVATLIFVGISVSGMRFITFQNDSRMFFSDENPQLKALEALENTYTKSDNVMFVIAPKDGKVFTAKTLAAVEELTELSWQIDYSSRVDSISNFQHTKVYDDDLIVRDLVQNPSSLSGPELKEIKKIAISEPSLVNRLISPSGHVTAINVTILKPEDAINGSEQITVTSREMAEKFREKYPEIDLYLTGGIIIDTAFGEAAQNDMSTLVPLMYLTLVIIMGLSLRSFFGTFSTLIIILISMLSAIGLAGWLGIDMSPASANAPTIILTLAIADSIHILVTFLHQLRLGHSKHDAISESLRINLQPVFITSLTTVIGFLTMNFSDAPPFRDLGNIVAIGVTLAFFFSVLFLPAFVAVLPLKVKARDEKESCHRLAKFVVEKRNFLFWSLIVMTVVLSAGTLRIELDDNFIEYFDETYSFRVASDFTENNLTGFDIIEYSLDSGESGGINSPEYLKKVEEFYNWYKAQENVAHVSSITDTIKRLNKNMHYDDEKYYTIPENRELAAQYLLLYEMSLPFGLDLNNSINVDKSATRFVVTLKNMTSKTLRNMDEKAREWLKSNAPKEMFTYGSGLSVMFAHISERNINSMMGASIGALVLISVILILALRSLKIGLISLIPNLTPAFMAFGVWGMMVGEVGLSVSIMVSLTLGIVVDDTVHFLSKYLRARREKGLMPKEAVLYSFHTVGKALWVTTFVLVAGFMVLSFSGFKVNSDMGLLTAITISLALVMDFLFLPTLLMKVEGK